MEAEQLAEPVSVAESEVVTSTPVTPDRTATVTMYTTTWCSDCVAAKRYLDAKGVDYREIDIEQEAAAAELVQRLNGGRRSVPTLVAGDVAASLSGFSPSKAHAFLVAAGLSSD